MKQSLWYDINDFVRFLNAAELPYSGYAYAECVAHGLVASQLVPSDTTRNTDGKVVEFCLLAPPEHVIEAWREFTAEYCLLYMGDG